MVRLAHGLAAGAVALAVAGDWLAAADDEPVAAEVRVTAAASLPATAAATAAATIDPPASAAPAPSALALAAARLCVDGCDEQPPPSSEPGAVTRIDVAILPMPADLDAWALSPEPLQIASVPPAVMRLFNTPPAPDENDSTPADESDPYAPPVELPATQP